MNGVIAAAAAALSYVRRAEKEREKLKLKLIPFIWHRSFNFLQLLVFCYRKYHSAKTTKVHFLLKLSHNRLMLRKNKKEKHRCDIVCSLNEIKCSTNVRQTRTCFAFVIKLNDSQVKNDGEKSNRVKSKCEISW
ncbi:CLUMA_CG012380, isoform A [Clunio marinus]|uniref:CLUMA_CG012380, isoform A n=1 Tax=Clunio marinus TaxID=568069 RepID=A0A1J1II42_9DIPT|nr:CLUMA_CG012380, isoform A [Clunio marinus]